MEKAADFSLTPTLFDPTEEITHLNGTSDREGVKIKKRDISKQQSFLQFATKLSKKILNGNLNILDLTLPSIMLHKETNLECCLQGFNLMTSFLNKAARVKDTISRLEITLTGVIANMTLPARRMKAQPPIPSFLGETLQVDNH